MRLSPRQDFRNKISSVLNCLCARPIQQAGSLDNMYIWAIKNPNAALHISPLTMLLFDSLKNSGYRVRLTGDHNGECILLRSDFHCSNYSLLPSLNGNSMMSARKIINLGAYLLSILL